MNIYFNDWSCAGQGSLKDHTTEINDFISLLRALASTRICTPVLDRKPTKLTLCDFAVSQCHQAVDDCKESDFRSRILGIFNYFSIAGNLDSTHFFTKQDAHNSVLLGNAHLHGCPTVSFCFDPLYASDTVVGMKNGRVASVTNLYRAGEIDALAPMLYSRADCATHKALEEPLWNKAATSEYMAKREAEITAAILANPDAKISILQHHATIIANLNGWVYNETVSKKNSNSGQIRHIFKAADLIGTAYLSVDFEKCNVFFELHNKRGKHCGEYKWDGSPSKNSDDEAHHDIKV
ncbi:MAG: hypothetical protein K2F78_00350 [Muribaculaceae bacterium]|nr:hypothetical protein [Muribaculaceae bacterium]